jgi:tight adherence protein C
MSGTLAFSSLCLIAGGLLITVHVLARRRPSLQVRLARSEGQATQAGALASDVPDTLQEWAGRTLAGYEQRLKRAGRDETARLFALKKLLLAVAVPLVPLLPYSAAVHHLPSPIIALALAVLGFFVPDLVLRSEAEQQREAIFLDLPEAISIMAISLHAGQSLRQALELAARDCEGPLGDELTRALSLARRDRTLGEREALVVVAKESREPSFVRFTELLAAKESPYLDFLVEQSQSLRAEQNRYLERASERAYLAMHAPVIPLIAVLVLVLAYGFIHFLTQTI